MSSSALSKNGTQASEIDLRLSELNDTVAVSEIFFSLTGFRTFLALPSSRKPLSEIWKQINMRSQIFINSRPFELAVKLKQYDQKNF